MRIYILIITIVLCGSISAQDVKFYGDFKPGSLVIGYDKDIKRVMLDTLQLPVDDGYFVLGFDRNDTTDHILNVKFNDGRVSVKQIKLPEREYRVQKINNMKQEYVSPPKEVEERIAKEREIIRDARSRIGEIDSALFKKGFIRPVNGGRLTSVFGSQRILNGEPRNPHNGLDIAAPTGTPVYAMSDGAVLLAADDFYYSGNFILLDHGMGLNSVYLHLNKKFVKAGDRVKKGDKIGEIGTTGRSTGPHLHWGVQWYGKRVDPQILLDMGL